jgi:hypothetical protein
MHSRGVRVCYHIWGILCVEVHIVCHYFRLLPSLIFSLSTSFDHYVWSDKNDYASCFQEDGLWILNPYSNTFNTVWVVEVFTYNFRISLWYCLTLPAIIYWHQNMVLLLELPREVRNNMFAHLIRASQDLSSILKVNRQLAKECIEEVTFYHQKHLTQMTSDLRIRFPQIDFEFNVPQKGDGLLAITTMTLSLPVSPQNIRNPITLGMSLAEVLRMRRLPLTETLKIVLQPQRMPAPQRMPEKSQPNNHHTSVHMIRYLGQFIVRKFVDRDEEVGEESVGRVIVCWDAGVNETALWRGLLRRIPPLTVQQSSCFGLDDWDEDGEEIVLWWRKDDA